jgi:hypothetical protein
MHQHRRQIATNIASEFLRHCFASGETIAVLLRRESPPITVQRIVSLECVLVPRYLGWLATENATGANIYVAANPLCPGSRRRTKECVDSIRHLYLDLDEDGESKLAALRCSNAVPIPNAIISTSPNKYQVLWQVEGFTFEQQESTLKLLAIQFGGDPACTDCNRVLRLPGFLNQKYDPAHLVSVEYPGESTSHAADFSLANTVPEPTLLAKPKGPRKTGGKHTNSEHDWVWVLLELAQGKDAEKLTRSLAERRSDKPNPLYYAQRTVDVASARLWLLEGAPVEDVITMLEVRRRFDIPSPLCSARAREIALTAERMIARKEIARLQPGGGSKYAAH